jgi:hypothetical protein
MRARDLVDDAQARVRMDQEEAAEVVGISVAFV